MKTPRKAFTLIELLIVIAVIAVLSVIVILTLNPAQLLAQARDSSRLNDLSTINSAVLAFSFDQATLSNFSLGTPNVQYLSIPDPTATTTAGTDCSGLGFAAGGTYHCAASSTYRKNDGTGWIPVNFTKMTAGAALATLPIDPINQSSSNEYYIYQTNGTNYEISANPESQKNQAIAQSNSVMFVAGSNTSLAGSFNLPYTYTLNTYGIAAAPEGMVFDSHTNTIWASGFGANTITQINDTTYATSTYSVAASTAMGIAFDSHTNTIWTANSGSSFVTQINDTTYVTSTYRVGNSPSGIAFDSHTNTIWVADQGVSYVTQINDTTFATSTYPVSGFAQSVAFDPHTNTLWVVGGSNGVTVINDTTYATSSYYVGPSPEGVAFDSHTNTVWIASYANSNVTQFNDTTYATSTFAVGVWPYNVAFDAHTNSIWVANSGNNTVTRINDTTYASSTYAAPSSAQDMVFDSHTNAMWAGGLGVTGIIQYTPNH